MAFTYSRHWYETEYTPWLEKLKSITDLDDEHVRQQRYKDRLHDWFSGLDLSGWMLELGHNDGKTIRWLYELFPELKIDVIDFNRSLSKISSWLAWLVPGLQSIWFGDVTTFVPERKYDIITSLDFFEHLPKEIYTKAIANCRYWLVPGGRLFVYAGTSRLPEHINLMTPDQTRDDVIRYGGFEFQETRLHGTAAMHIFKSPEG